jgi:hypothetical protein
MSSVHVDSANEEATILLDTRFYGYGSVLLTAQAFSEDCWIQLDGDTNDKLMVRIKPKSKDTDLHTVGFEFCNYALGLMQNART